MFGFSKKASDVSDNVQKYRADIDGLRAIAILLVTVFHFDLFSVGKAGFIGVDVFFAISGFLITSIIVRELERGDFSYGRFLYRRVRRLYPALTVTLALFLVAGSFLLLPDAFRELGRESVLSQLYVVNFYFWRTVNYFGLHAANVPLLHMWSLAIEEQFYLFFPLLCIAVWRWRPGSLTAVIVTGTLASFLLGLVVTPWKPWAAFYLLPTRAWELLAGGALALILRSRPAAPALARGLGPLGLGLIAVSVWLYTPATMVPGWYAALPVSGALCLIAGGLNRQAPVTRLLSARPMVLVGLISYPLYLVHWPVLFLMRESLFEFSLPWRVTGFVLSFVLAWLIYALVETPIRQGKRLRAPRLFLGAAGSVSAVLVAASFLILSQNGLPQRFAPEVAEILAYKDDEARGFRSCENRLRPSGSDPCRLGDPDAVPDMLVFGDSHANAFAHAIDLWLARTGRAAYFSFSHGCLPVGNLGPPDCEAHFDAALSFVDDTPGIDTVMILSIWLHPYGGGMLHEGRWTPAGEIEDVFVAELRNSVQAFADRGAGVVLVDPFFLSPSQVPRALAGNLAFGRNWPVDKPLEAYRAEFARLFAAFDAASDVGARHISLIGDLCRGGVCRAIHDSRPVFTDNNHIADAMSEVMSRVFEREMAALKSRHFSEGERAPRFPAGG